MNGNTSKIKTTEVERLQEVSNTLAKEVIDSINKAAASGLNICNATRSTLMVILEVNHEAIGNYEDALSHVVEHLEEVYEAVAEPQEQVPTMPQVNRAKMN